MKIKNMTDEQVLEKFIKFLESGRIELQTKFIQDPDTGNITHQVVYVSAGEFVTISKPEMLDVPLRPAVAEELGETIN